MLKRPRLSATKRLVNALPILALLFLTTACGRPVETPQDNPSNQAVPEAETGLVLPAVWSTRDLGGAISSVAVAGELGSTIAVSYRDGGLQFFNFEGDRITDKADLNVAALGDGRYLLLSGVAVTLFPGINRSGDLEIYIHGGQLPEPLAYSLDIGQDGMVAGLCTAPPETETDGVLRLAFWMQDGAQTLLSGRVVEIGEELVFLPDEPVEANAPISACLLEDTGATVFAAPALASVSLNRRGRSHTITLDTSGNYTVSRDGGAYETLTIRDGISVRMASVPVDMAGTSDTRGGGYPGGILVIAGRDENNEDRLVFIDPSALTLTPFE